MTKNKKVVIEISRKSILFIAGLILILVFFHSVSSIVIGLFLAYLVSVAINPLVNLLEKLRLPRALSAFIILILIFSSLITLVASMVRPLIIQTQGFLEQLPSLIQRLSPYYLNYFNLSDLTQIPQLYTAPSNVVKLAIGTFSGLVSFFTLLVISFYLMQDRPNLKNHLHYLFGENKGDLYYKILCELETRLGHWFRGEIILMLVVGFLSYFGFSLIGLPSAIPLAVIAGALELIPNIGPTIAAIPAVIVGFSLSPTHGFMTLGLTILIQQLENNLIVPKIMQHAADLHPVITIIALLTGFQLGGPFLAVLSLPIVISLQVILHHLRTKPNKDLPEIC